MAAYLSPFYTALESLVSTAVPSLLQGAGGGGIWRASRIMRTPLDDVLLTYGTPFGIVHIAGLTAGDWGMSNYSYETRAELFVVQQGAEDEEGMLTMLEALRDGAETAIGTGSLSSGQLLEVLELSWSPQMPINQTATNKQLDILAGMVAVRCVVGEIGP